MLLLCFDSMKYFILVALFFVVRWGLRRLQVSRSRAQAPVAREPESMVKCAFCGVNQPISESIRSDGHYFCSAAHRNKAGAQDD